MMNGVLASPPNADCSSTGIAADGTLRVDRVRFAGTWQGTGQRRPLLLNKEPAPEASPLHALLGPTTPASTETVELVLSPFPAAQPLRDLVGTVVQGKQGGGTPIQPGGAVLVGRGATGAGKIASEAPIGSNVTVRLTLTPDWSGSSSTRSAAARCSCATAVRSSARTRASPSTSSSRGSRAAPWARRRTGG